jgi:hypothetical protein
MPNTPKIPSFIADAMLNASYANGSLNNGSLKIYTGAQPASSGDAVVAQILLVSLPLNPIAFNAAGNGSTLARAIGPAQVVAAGTASWFRLSKQDGTGTLDGSVGLSGCDMNLNKVTFNVGETILITMGAISIPLQ